MESTSSGSRLSSESLLARLMPPQGRESASIVSSLNWAFPPLLAPSQAPLPLHINTSSAFNPLASLIAPVSTAQPSIPHILPSSTFMTPPLSREPSIRPLASAAPLLDSHTSHLRALSVPPVTSSSAIFNTPLPTSFHPLHFPTLALPPLLARSYVESPTVVQILDPSASREFEVAHSVPPPMSPSSTSQDHTSEMISHEVRLLNTNPLALTNPPLPSKETKFPKFERRVLPPSQLLSSLAHSATPSIERLVRNLVTEDPAREAEANCDSETVDNYCHGALDPGALLLGDHSSIELVDTTSISSSSIHVEPSHLQDESGPESSSTGVVVCRSSSSENLPMVNSNVLKYSLNVPIEILEILATVLLREEVRMAFNLGLYRELLVLRTTSSSRNDSHCIELRSFSAKRELGAASSPPRRFRNMNVIPIVEEPDDASPVAGALEMVNGTDSLHSRDHSLRSSRLEIEFDRHIEDCSLPTVRDLADLDALSVLEALPSNISYTSELTELSSNDSTLPPEMSLISDCPGSGPADTPIASICAHLETLGTASKAWEAHGTAEACPLGMQFMFAFLTSPIISSDEVVSKPSQPPLGVLSSSERSGSSDKSRLDKKKRRATLHASTLHPAIKKSKNGQNMDL